MVGLIARVSRAWLRGDRVDNRAHLRAAPAAPICRFGVARMPIRKSLSTKSPVTQSEKLFSSFFILLLSVVFFRAQLTRVFRSTSEEAGGEKRFIRRARRTATFFRGE